MTLQGVLSSKIGQLRRPNAEIVESLLGLGVATIHESIGKGIPSTMNDSVKPISLGMKLAGPAVTVDCFPADNLTVHLAMTMCKRGEILVVNGHGVPGVMWGGIMTYQAIRQGIAGIVVDGAVRDTEEIRKMRFPCFAKLVNPIGSAKATLGSVNKAIQCGGVVVNPGDWIVGDDDGVVVIRQESVAQVIERARERLEKEEQYRKLMDGGATSLQIYHLDEIVGKFETPASGIRKARFPSPAKK